MLAARGVAPHDETGWKLSTTRAAANLMSGAARLRPDASERPVLDWLKSAPRPRRPRWSGALERACASAACATGAAGAPSSRASEQAAGPGAAAVHGRRRARSARRWRAARPLADWLAATRDAARRPAASGPRCSADVAGIEVIAALHLDDRRRGRRLPQARALHAWPSSPPGRATCSRPRASCPCLPAPTRRRSSILPLHQLLGRPFAAVVVPGCDDQRLPASPEPPGDWTAAQRAALGAAVARGAGGRPARRLGHRAARAALRSAVARSSMPAASRCAPVRWCRCCSSTHAAQPPARPARCRVQVAAQPTPRPQPRGDALPLARSRPRAYEDLRRCPYRFFALRQLGLRSSDELDAEVDKRDFGNWLHAVLGHFHEALHDSAEPRTLPARLALMASRRSRRRRASSACPRPSSCPSPRPGRGARRLPRLAGRARGRRGRRVRRGRDRGRSCRSAA